MSARIDITGMRFSRLVAVERMAGGKRGTWLFQCDCGQTKEISHHNVIAGLSKSCGCLKSEMMKAKWAKHPRPSKTPMYKIWIGIKERCFQENSTNFHHYGGRGITMSYAWYDYNTFKADMGERPSPKHSIDRIDTNGNYCKENCKWSTRSEQCNNKRNNVNITIGPVTLTAAQWEKERGFKPSFITKRINGGWSPEMAVLTPVDRRFSHPKKSA